MEYTPELYLVLVAKFKCCYVRVFFIWPRNSILKLEHLVFQTCPYLIQKQYVGFVDDMAQVSGL